MIILRLLDPTSRLRRVKHRLTGCCLLLALSGLLACGALLVLAFYFGREVAAQSPREAPLGVYLLIDNSLSMWEKEGIGSDPDLLRIEAARLFISYLGVDSQLIHHLGVIFFGGEARQVVPLTPLTDDARRAELAQLIADPPRMRWTNPVAALDLAEQSFKTASDTPPRRVIVLLTDGKPEMSNAPTPAETTATIAQLRESAARLAQQDISLVIILLQNTATDADPDIEQTFVPLWQEIAAATPLGRFYRARQSEELLDVYHDIVVSLTGRQTAGVVFQTQVQTSTVERIVVEPDLAQLTLVVRKSDPALEVTIRRPDGRRLQPNEPGLQYAGQPGQSREEVWAINQPPPGEWLIQLNGQGMVTVWKDFYPAPPTPTFTPSPTFTSTSTPTRTPTSTPTPTPSVTATPFPSPTLPPSATPHLPVVPPPSSPSPPSFSDHLIWAAALSLSGLGLVVGLWWWLRQQRTRPLLEGTLRWLAAPAATSAQTIPARFDLDQLRRSEIRLGNEPDAELSLPPAGSVVSVTVRLVARREPDGQLSIAVVTEPAASDHVRVNNVPVSGEWPLQDGDVLEVGGYRFRYENLRRRAETRRTWQQSPLNY